MEKITLFYIFVTAFSTSLVLIPPVSRLAVTIGVLDRPDARKLHGRETPRLGGIAIFFAFVLTVALFGEIDQHTRGFLAGATIIFLTGLADDLKSLSPGKKFIGQFLAATCSVIVSGLSLQSLGNPFGFGEMALGPFSVPFTVLAIVGVTNAVNLIDGLDGLAGGVIAIASGAFAILAYLSGNVHLMCMAVALVGSILGFLKYNTYPARIFMGDSGSLFLGYTAGFFSIMLAVKSGGRISEIAPLTILAIPVFDTIYVMTRRIRNGRHPFAPDRTHIHHRLLGAGFGHQATVVIVYSITYLLALAATLGNRLPDNRQAVILVTICVAVYVIQSVLSSRVQSGEWGFLRGNNSLRHTWTYRRLVSYAQHLRVVVKYLIIASLLLGFFTRIPTSQNNAIIALALFLISSALIFMTHNWGNRFLIFVLYFDGAFLLFQTENYAGEMAIAGVTAATFSHILFFLLFLCCTLKLIFRRRLGDLVSSPLECLILFIVVSVPLLPRDFLENYHLLTVAGKSVILFAGYKLILLRQANRNRKIIIATLLALFAVALKGIL